MREILNLDLPEFTTNNVNGQLCSNGKYSIKYAKPGK